LNGGEKTARQAEMLGNRAQKKYKRLKKWAARTGAGVYRLYDRDIPEIPLVLDIYGDAVAGALYERPYEKDDDEEGRWLDAMTAAIAGTLEIPLDRIFLKRRKRQRAGSQGRTQYEKNYEKNAAPRFIRDVREGGLVFRVNLSDYLDTGLFPDRRKMRALLRSEAAGKRVLNLFCYTASFSVYAAAGGALTVDSVDLSNTYLDWAAVNFGLNHLETRLVDAGEILKPGLSPGSGSRGRFQAQVRQKRESPCPYRLIRADVLSFLDGAAKAGLSWDIIILDPPTFSNSKKMKTTLDLKRDYRGLVSRSLKLLNPGGTLWFSANARRFRLEAEDFPGVEIRDRRNAVMDEDFRGKNIPLCYTLKKSNIPEAVSSN
jgi:23S rRNA G2069 N7-methylase RlmK/C1962 C5-methylase RlmI